MACVENAFVVEVPAFVTKTFRFRFLVSLSLSTDSPLTDLVRTLPFAMILLTAVDGSAIRCDSFISVTDILFGSVSLTTFPICFEDFTARWVPTSAKTDFSEFCLECLWLCCFLGLSLILGAAVSRFLVKSLGSITLPFFSEVYREDTLPCG